MLHDGGQFRHCICIEALGKDECFGVLLGEAEKSDGEDHLKHKPHGDIAVRCARKATGTVEYLCLLYELVFDQYRILHLILVEEDLYQIDSGLARGEGSTRA